MLNKNANCYNIEKNFKYTTVIKTFSERITIFRTLSIDIWQPKCPQRQTELSNFSSLSIWRKPLWKQKLLLLSYTLVRPFPTLSCFPFFHKLFWKLFWKQKLLVLTATARRSCCTLVRPFPMLSCFPFFYNFFWN